jgi:hypothetical protein
LKVGSVAGTFPRSAENIPLLDEDLLNRRRLGGPTSRLDSMGEAYLTRQEVYLAQRFANLIEFQTASMLRGSYTFAQDGDDLRHGFSGGETTVVVCTKRPELAIARFLAGISTKTARLRKQPGQARS